MRPSALLLLVALAATARADVRVDVARADGVTTWVDGQATADEPWEGDVRAPAGSWLVVEVLGTGVAGADADVDLELRGVDDGGLALTSSSHLARERLLAPTAACHLRVVVDRLDPARRTGGFRLGVTALPGGAALTPGQQAAAGALGADGRRVAAWSLAASAPPGVGPGESKPMRALLRGEPSHDLELLVFDATLAPIEACSGPAPACLLELEGDGPTYFVALARAGRGDVQLVVRGPTKDEKELDPSPLDVFLDGLARTDDQRAALAALRRHPDFVAMCAYLEGYPGGIPIRLRVAPGHVVDGVERFGSYSPRSRTLTINPTIAGHRENVQELMDTLVHELVHALLALRRAPGYPLATDVLDAGHDPRVARLGPGGMRRGRAPEPLLTYLEESYGPSASNPDEDYTDINAGTQRLIVKVIEENLARTGLGHETLVFENVRARLEGR